jgi:hypothetical protein
MCRTFCNYILEDNLQKHRRLSLKMAKTTSYHLESLDLGGEDLVKLSKFTLVPQSYKVSPFFRAYDSKG